MSIDRRKSLPTSSETEILRQRGYYITHLLGQGSFSKVYRTEYITTHPYEKIKLACKLIDTTLATVNYVQKFLPQELQIIAQLNHPHIIQIHSIFQIRNKYYLFMQHAENGDLLDFIIRYGPLKEDLARVWLRQISLAIQYLHILEIAHRDIKCDNILISIHNNVKLTDFGFSRFLIDNNKKIMQCETYCGTMSYASPQVLLGDPYNAKATDIWSLGVVLYVMLNKSTPFNSDNLKTMIEQQLARNYKFRVKYVAQYGKEVMTLVSYLLEPKEYIRYKIEQVLASDWMSMEPSLKVLNRLEFNALASALEKAKRSGIVSNDKISTNRSTTKGNSIMSYLKECNEGFDLSVLNSDISQKRLST